MGFYRKSMKKNLISLFVMFLASITLSAQSGMTYSWEFVAGVGVGRGPQVSITPEFVAQYDLGGGFRIGAGVFMIGVWLAARERKSPVTLVCLLNHRSVGE